MFEHRVRQHEIEYTTCFRNCVSGRNMQARIEWEFLGRFCFQGIEVDADELPGPRVAQEDIGENAVAAAQIEPETFRQTESQESSDFDPPPIGRRGLDRIGGDEVAQEPGVAHSGFLLLPNARIECCNSRISIAQSGPIGATAFWSPRIAAAKRAKTSSLP